MDMYRRRYNEVLDTVLSSFRNRYPPGVWQHITHIEQFAIENEDLTYVTKFYGDSLEPGRLLLHRDILIDIIKQHNSAALHTFHDVVQIFSGDKGQHLRNRLLEMAKLIKIAASAAESAQLSIPVTSCTSERSFSCLQRLKTYLRSTMALLHAHKELSCKINLNDAANEFISRYSVRMNTFSTSARSSDSLMRH
ncbi:unnamed protein product [Ixodes persulcatus]